MDSGAVLTVEGLRTQFSTKEGVVKAANGVDLTVKPGHMVACDNTISHDPSKRLRP